MPLDELSSSEGCLAEYISQKTAEILAAKGDPKKVFGRHQLSPLPDADAVDLCVGQIHSANACLNFVAVRRVSQIDNQVAEQNALVTAQIEMVVLSPFAACSPIASSCTGMCWDMKSDKPKLAAQHQRRFFGGAPVEDREGFRVPENRQRWLALQHDGAAAGGFRRCGERALAPTTIYPLRYRPIQPDVAVHLEMPTAVPVWRKNDDTNFLFFFSHRVL